MKKIRSKLHPTKIGVIKTFSLSPNDEIGEIAVECTGCTYYYNNLAELCEKWEDYEEPKDVWWLDNEGNVNYASRIDDYSFEKNKQIGNYFKTKEEAERAVAKLKALKRLKDKGFRFRDWNIASNGKGITIFANYPSETRADLDLLFGGEE